ncbi:hypothetical protein M422DRAFT_67525 [Sphaerobolus stellatus SS14]|uniref:WD40 repeat-like protein n=1 Tax=Sphaerobolus stellatus (strain SS14) TaxID=990650 RepID=A0A0C9VB76_SPHS4|nr:hypothetical protein M422DRAFT_67525 [Sphaerobolus stellatus SS14]
METTDVNNLFRAEADIAKDLVRQEKAERTKDLGSPLELSGKVLSLVVRGSEAWTAEGGRVARRIDLETGKTLQIYKGHGGPVTCLALHEDLLFTGSWDKTIKVWRTSEKSLLGSTDAHTDFVKTLLVIPSLSILVSGSSDKVVRFWDISGRLEGPLFQMGSLAAHTRPVEALSFSPEGENSGTLYTTDTLGLVKAWDLERTPGDKPSCRTTFKADLESHRTGVTDVWIGNGYVWSASKDENVMIQPVNRQPNTPKKTHVIQHPRTVNVIFPLSLSPLQATYFLTASGDLIRIYSFDPEHPEDSPDLVNEIDAHWDDVTGLGLWLRTEEKDGKKTVEPWILSAGLDATIRHWRLTDMLDRTKYKANPIDEASKKVEPVAPASSGLTEEEERELAELMEDE